MIEKNKVSLIYKRLESLCEQNNTKITPLCVEITGNKGNLSTWKKGNIRNDYLVKIAEKFNVTTDYLLCKTDDATPPNTAEENERILNIKWGSFGVSFDDGTHMNDLSNEEKEELTDLFKLAVQQRIERNKRKAEKEKQDK